MPDGGFDWHTDHEILRVSLRGNDRKEIRKQEEEVATPHHFELWARGWIGVCRDQGQSEWQSFSEGPARGL